MCKVGKSDFIDEIKETVDNKRGSKVTCSFKKETSIFGCSRFRAGVGHGSLLNS